MNVEDAAKLAAIVAKVSTVGVARATLGYATGVLAQGYAQISNIPTTAIGGLLFGVSTDTPTETQDAAKGLLDTVNNYAGLVYARLPADDDSQAGPLSLKDHLAVAAVFTQSADALAFIEKQITDLAFDFIGGLQSAATTAGAALGHGLQAITNAAAGGIWAFVRGAWPTLLIVAGVVALVWWAKSRAWKAVLS